MSSSIRTLRSRVPVKTEVEVDISADTKLTKNKSRKRKDVKQESQIKQEIGTEVETLDSVTDVKHSKLDLPEVSRKAHMMPKNERNRRDVKREPGLNQEIDSEVQNLDSVTDVKQSKLDLNKFRHKASIMPKKERIRKDVKQEPEINQEIDSEVENLDSVTDVKLDFPKVSRKASMSPKGEKTAKSSLKTSIHFKKDSEDAIGDIENAGWKPENWREVWENILKMRKLHVAPVDSLGCEACPDKNVPPEVFRYQTLISVMLSSQTKDEVTYAATKRMIAHGLDVDTILNTSDEKIGELIYPASFWKSKVKYVKNTTQILKDQYNGDIPRTFKELCKLPGVGPKMANIVMSVGWNDTVGIAVDTHVHRISNRLGWVPKPTKDPEQTMKALESWLPKELWEDGSSQLAAFGQTICRSIKPLCKECLNVQLCPFGRSNKI